MASVYKTTFALVATGRLHAAWRLMDYIAKNYMTEPCEFHADNDNERDDWMAYYRNCYVLIAALRLGRFDIASPTAIKHFLRYQHQSGVFCGSFERSKRRQINTLFTCMGGWICLYAAQWRCAVAAGDFIIRLIKNQPAMPRRFYVETEARTGQCIVDFDPGTGIAHFVNQKRACQNFFYSGAMMGFLADLYRATEKINILMAH